MAKRGRPKGSKNKPKTEKAIKERTSKRIVTEETTFMGQGQGGVQPLTLVQKTERYTFRNLGPGMFYVTPDFGSKTGRDTKKIPPGMSRDDITEKERKRILESQMYLDGIVVEEIPDEVGDSVSPNSLNDRQLKKLLLMDNDDIKSHILQMDSVFSLNRVKEKIIEQDLPAYLIKLIDSQIEEIQLKYAKEKEAPVSTFKERGV